MALKFDIKKSGFPVKIGDIEFWFDDSHEAMREFIEKDNESQKNLDEIKKKSDEIQASDDNELAKADKAFELKKEELTIQYDTMFGDGAFEKLYAEYPNIRELEKILIPIDAAVGEAVTKRLEEDKKERSKIIESKKQELLNKQKAKQKK
ncbi:hypothetical protein ACDX78_10275 [Virgibacillus oceani]